MEKLQSLEFVACPYLEYAYLNLNMVILFHTLWRCIVPNYWPRGTNIWCIWFASGWSRRISGTSSGEPPYLCTISKVNRRGWWLNSDEKWSHEKERPLIFSAWTDVAFESQMNVDSRNMLSLNFQYHFCSCKSESIFLSTACLIEAKTCSSPNGPDSVVCVFSSQRRRPHLWQQ